MPHYALHFVWSMADNARRRSLASSMTSCHIFFELHKSWAITKKKIIKMCILIIEGGRVEKSDWIIYDLQNSLDEKLCAFTQQTLIFCESCARATRKMWEWVRWNKSRYFSQYSKSISNKRLDSLHNVSSSREPKQQTRSEIFKFSRRTSEHILCNGRRNCSQSEISSLSLFLESHAGAIRQ